MATLPNKTSTVSRLGPAKGKKSLKFSRSVNRWAKLAIPRPDILNSYLSHNEINQYMDFLERRYGTYVAVHTIGHSHERRPIKAIEIDWSRVKNGDVKPRPPEREDLFAQVHRRNMVMIEGGTHGREWITITTALACIYQLTERNLRNRDLLKKMRFYIVPLSNPDGYEYSRSKNRQWRKNRRPTGCVYIGTDCNRNYDIHWSLGNTRSSRNTYKGEKPFSEPETRALRNVMVKYQNDLLLFLSFHSYAQSIMYPWGISYDMPETWCMLHSVASNGRQAIKEYSGRNYRIGSIANVSNHTITGSIVDYAFGVMKVPVALVMELPSIQYGFQPPAEVINTIGQESWCGVRQMCRTSFELLPQYECGVPDTPAATKRTEPPLFNPPPSRNTVLVRKLFDYLNPEEKCVFLSLSDEDKLKPCKYIQNYDAWFKEHQKSVDTEQRVEEWVQQIDEGPSEPPKNPMPLSQRSIKDKEAPKTTIDQLEKRDQWKREKEKRARRDKRDVMCTLTTGKVAKNIDLDDVTRYQISRLVSEMSPDDFKSLLDDPIIKPFHDAVTAKNAREKRLKRYGMETPRRLVKKNNMRDLPTAVARSVKKENMRAQQKKFFKDYSDDYLFPMELPEPGSKPISKENNYARYRNMTTAQFFGLPMPAPQKSTPQCSSDDYVKLAESVELPPPRRFDPVRMEELAKPKVPPRVMHYSQGTMKKLKLDENLGKKATTAGKVKYDAPRRWPKRKGPPVNVHVRSYVEQTPPSAPVKHCNGLQPVNENGTLTSVFDLDSKPVWPNATTGLNCNRF